VLVVYYLPNRGCHRALFLRDKMDPTRQEPQDGDAAYLEAGSPLYRVDGYRPTFRLGARQDGRLVLFEADTNPRARVGRDLLDLEGVDRPSQPADEQPVWLLAFHLRDGTATVRAYDHAQRRVERGILVPRRFDELVQAAGS
jgi:hypothetical protein